MSGWKQCLKVAWGVPHHGWLPLEIEGFRGEISLAVYNPFDELERAMADALSGVSRPARLWLEPAFLELEFEPEQFSIWWLADDHSKEREHQLSVDIPLARQVRTWLRAFEKLSQAYRPEWTASSQRTCL